MSLLSLITDPLDCFRPSLLLDQNFGMGLDEDDFLEPCISPYPSRRLRRQLLSAPYSRNWRSLARKAPCSNLKDKFQVSLDVQQFSPEEITVKASENTITVEGKHEEKEDEHGYISRHFVRKYTLPEGHDVNLVESKLSSDGVLTIMAPKVQKEKESERVIPISFTGQPSKASVEAKPEKKCEDKVISIKKK